MFRKALQQKTLKPEARPTVFLQMTPRAEHGTAVVQQRMFRAEERTCGSAKDWVLGKDNISSAKDT